MECPIFLRLSLHTGKKQSLPRERGGWEKEGREGEHLFHFRSTVTFTSSEDDGDDDDSNNHGLNWWWTRRPCIIIIIVMMACEWETEDMKPPYRESLLQWWWLVECEHFEGMDSVRQRGRSSEAQLDTYKKRYPLGNPMVKPWAWDGRARKRKFAPHKNTIPAGLLLLSLLGIASCCWSWLQQIALNPLSFGPSSSLRLIVIIMTIAAWIIGKLTLQRIEREGKEKANEIHFFESRQSTRRVLQSTSFGKDWSERKF